MGVLTIPLGVSITNNPVKESPFVDVVENPDMTPAGPEYNLMTENGEFLLTENGDFLTTE